MVLGYFLVLLVSLAAPPPSTAAQEPRSLFDAATVQLSPGVAPFRRVADLDLDGDPDAVGVVEKSDRRFYKLYSYGNDGEGRFTTRFVAEQAINPPPAGTLLIEVGRRNTDAWPDVCIVFGSAFGNWAVLQEWYGNGDGTFAVQPQVVLSSGVTKMALADLNADGVDDFVCLNRTRLRLTISGNSYSIPVGGEKHGLAVLLRDGPDGSDVFLIDAAYGLRIVYGDAENGLVLGPEFPHGVAMSMLDTGDVDGDGDLDAVVFGMMSYRVLRRDGPGSWTMEAERTGGPAEFLHDIDGDGDLDGVCCAGGGGGGGSSYPDNVLPSDFELSLNDGTGAFAPAFKIHGVGSPQLAGVADVDGDGDVDLVAGRCVYFADGPIREPAGGSALLPPHGPRALADCDGDGDVDVGFSVDSVYSNDGTGRFEAREPLVFPAPPGTAYRGPGYPGDFDGDGDVDLVVELRPRGGARELAHALPGSDGAVAMALLRNAGEGALLEAVPASRRGVSFALEGHDPELSLLVDADQDGDLDLMTRTLSYGIGSRSRLWANDGRGFFLAGGERGDRALWTGDVDLDGDMDMIVAGGGYGGTSTYLLRGSNPTPGHLPTLTWESRFRGSLGSGWVHEAAAGISAVDFAQDGYPDFVCANWPSRNHSLPEAQAFDNRFASGGTFACFTITYHSTLAQAYLSPQARVVAGGSAPLVSLTSGLEDDFAEVTAVHRRDTGGPLSWGSFREWSPQVLPQGLLVDLDGDGELDVLGRWRALRRAAP